jgi:RimJ/RimL family protein N-acetyltransferase
MRYLYGEDALVADFVARMIPHVGARGFDKCRAIGIVNDDDELVAGILFHLLSPAAGIMEITIAALPGHQWLTRSTLALYRYPFLQQGCQMVVATVPASDERSLRILAVMGFELVKHRRLFGRHMDGVIASLTYEDWLENKVCQRALKARALTENDEGEHRGEHLWRGSNATAGLAQHDHAGAHGAI